MKNNSLFNLFRLFFNNIKLKQSVKILIEDEVH